jgi:hypothetical protein
MQTIRVYWRWDKDVNRAQKCRVASFRSELNPLYLVLYFWRSTLNQEGLHRRGEGKQEPLRSPHSCDRLLRHLLLEVPSSFPTLESQFIELLSYYTATLFPTQALVSITFFNLRSILMPKRVYTSQLNAKLINLIISS